MNELCRTVSASSGPRFDRSVYHRSDRDNVLCRGERPCSAVSFDTLLCSSYRSPGTQMLKFGERRKYDQGHIILEDNFEHKLSP